MIHGAMLAALLAAAPAASAAPAAAAEPALATELLRELVEIPSVSGTPATRAAAQAMAARLRAAGFGDDDVRLLPLDADTGNLVARYRSAAPRRRPLLLLAHLDVVPARRADWSVEPFRFLERDGYYYGRGSSDNKAGAAMLIANLIRFEREGYAPDRDLVVVLTGDEETTGASMRWLLREHRDLVDAEFALNSDAGDGLLLDGRKAVFNLQTAEKIYQSYFLTARNRGGHSSLPVADNAIYRLAAALQRLAQFEFPVALNETTRGYFAATAALAGPEQQRAVTALLERNDVDAARRVAASSAFANAMLRTTCVATRLEGGHADNALPQAARATINCRILPGVAPATVQADLIRAIADPGVAVEAEAPDPDRARFPPRQVSPASPLTPAVLAPLQALVGEMFPDAVVVPQMSTGATDGRYVREAGIPVYGTSAIFDDPDDVRAHGRDERVPVAAFAESVEFWYRLVKAYSGG